MYVDPPFFLYVEAVSLENDSRRGEEAVAAAAARRLLRAVFHGESSETACDSTRSLDSKGDWSPGEARLMRPAARLGSAGRAPPLILRSGKGLRGTLVCGPPLFPICRGSLVRE